jgi:hypothetical protein
MKEKEWSEFRNTGLFLFINSILHIFGWAIVLEMDNDTKEIIRAYPARVSYRGFPEESVEKAYIKISEYMIENAKDLLDESKGLRDE